MSKGRDQTSALCIVIAGPNGAGKTTFAKNFLQEYADVIYFVNADEIARGLSPLKPELAQISAGKIFLSEIDRLSSGHIDFAFETTLSGLTYLHRLSAMKQKGYFIRIVFLKLHSSSLAIKRVKARVKQGGHDVLEGDIVRRYERGWENFNEHYRDLADDWAVYDNSGKTPKFVEDKATYEKNKK